MVAWTWDGCWAAMIASGFGVVGVMCLRLAVRLSKRGENKGWFGVYMAAEIGLEGWESWFPRHLRKLSKDDDDDDDELSDVAPEESCSKNARFVMMKKEDNFFIDFWREYILS